MDLTLQMLTPLWTGGVEGQPPELHETGIIGGMRWWYEAIVRGVGGRVCNPVGRGTFRTKDRDGNYLPDNPEGKCILDPKLLPPEGLSSDPATRRDQLYKAGLCDVCQLFGTTGWRRQFSLRLDTTGVRPHTQKTQRCAHKSLGAKRASCWWFPATVFEGELVLKILPFNSQVDADVIAGLVWFISEYAAFGAKTQLGHGIVELEETVDSQMLYDRAKLVCHTVQPDPDWPGLHNIILAKVNNLGREWEDMLTFKSDLRKQVRGEQRSRMFGDVQGQDRRATRFKLSKPYGLQHTIRLWGWYEQQDAHVMPRIERFAHAHWDDVSDHNDDTLTWLADLLEVPNDLR